MEHKLNSPNYWKHFTNSWLLVFIRDSLYLTFLFFSFLIYIYVYSCVKVIQRYLPHFSEELKIISHHRWKHTWTNSFARWHGLQFSPVVLSMISTTCYYFAVAFFFMPPSLARVLQVLNPAQMISFGTLGFLQDLTECSLRPCDAVTLVSCSRLPSGSVLLGNSSLR